MVAGNPAKFIGYTEDFYRKLKKDHDTKTGKLTAIEKKKFLMSMNEDTFEVKPCIKIER